MNVCDRRSSFKHKTVARRGAWRVAHLPDKAFTLLEVLIVMTLLTILMVTGFRAIFSMKGWSRRLADNTAAMAVVEAKVHDIRAATYNPPSAYFSLSTNAVYLTNSGSIALNSAGATFFVSGNVVSKIQLVPAGHLVTVTGTFQSPGKPVTVSLQTLVNKFSGGQQ